MEITGVVINAGTVETVGANNTKKRTFVIEFMSGEYKKQLAFDVFKDKAEQFHPTNGDQVTVQFDVNSREYNGKWYTNATAWKWDITGRQEDPEPVTASDIASEEGDPLPF